MGLVISGEYFGWNYGWGVSGTIGFLIATLLVTVMYGTFIFSYTELTAAIPHAGGAFAYAYRAMGPMGGLVAGYATLVDFLLATPAIAFALGSYLHFLYPSVGVIPSALAFNVVFMLLNASGVKESAVFSVFITALAVIELLIFMGIVAPHFKMDNFMTDPMPFGWSGIRGAAFRGVVLPCHRRSGHGGGRSEEPCAQHPERIHLGIGHAGVPCPRCDDSHRWRGQLACIQQYRLPITGSYWDGIGKRQ